MRLQVRHEALSLRIEVEGLLSPGLRGGRVKLAAACCTGRWSGWEQPRQTRGGPVLPDGPGSGSETGRHTRGTGVWGLFTYDQLQPGGYGLVRGAHPAVCREWTVGELLGGSWLLAWEVTVKVYGVAVTMPQGYSWVPHPSTGRQW